MTLSVGCRNLGSESDTTGSAPFELSTKKENVRAYRVKLLDDLRDVAMPIFQRIAERYKEDKIKDPKSKEIAKRFLQTIENMTTHSNPPINPLAFFAMIKDFELANSEKWANPISDDELYKYEYISLMANRNNKAYLNKLGINSTKNCTSGLCLGNFQVDVLGASRIRMGKNIELDERYGWEASKFCSSKSGLGIASLKGGMDFCTAIYWWNYANNGFKCKLLMRKKLKRKSTKINPCSDPKVSWSYKLVSYGRLAYGQQIQNRWKKNKRISWVWGKQYLFYENVLLSEEKDTVITGVDGKRIRDQIDDLIQNESKISFKRSNYLRRMVCQFKKDMGFGEIAGYSNSDCINVVVNEDSKWSQPEESKETLDTPGKTEPSKNYDTYTCDVKLVRSGETLYGIANGIVDTHFFASKYLWKNNVSKSTLIREIAAHIKELNDIDDSDTIKASEILYLPMVTHWVNGGESLSSISNDYKLSRVGDFSSLGAMSSPWEWIKKQNGLISDSIALNQMLKIYAWNYCLQEKNIEL